MKGTFLHRRLGDRILQKGLWSPTRESLARGWLVGWPITVVPFLPGQTLFAVVAALLVRGNLLLCIALQFLSNPFTATVHLPACYFVGEVVRGADITEVWSKAWNNPGNLVSGNAAASLYIGGFVIGLLGGAIGYAAILGLWKEKPRRRTLPPLPLDETNGAPAASAADPAQLKLPLREPKETPPAKTGGGEGI